MIRQALRGGAMVRAARADARFGRVGAGRKVAGAGALPFERRREHRAPAEGRVVARVVCAERLALLPMDLMDSSDTGLGVRSGGSMEVGAVVDLCMGQRPVASVRATVARCEAMDDGSWRVGLRLGGRAAA